MKNIWVLIALSMTVVSLAGCKGKKDNETIIAKKVVKKAPTGPIRQQSYTQNKNIDFAGSRLSCTIQRTPDDSLQMVVDENGQKYVDNVVTLTITRKDGSVFFKKTFTKKSFEECLDKDYRQRGLLEGFVYDKVEEGALYFAASVCRPQDDDEFIPLVVKLSANGTLSISRDTQIDTNGAEGDDDL